ncbi:hypothetical protein B0H17DRAFT_1133271 [Mycena rosella]|uniref:Uncharacterized protein n=1 Tax=Mycena rosella TaxID=1033263 RepID=A0AAD7DIN1_MYCRO|nr:hypothetical protein B0H17DRAFT_1133271 [Mycena rosella]
MDDTQFVGSISSSVLLEFRGTQFPAPFIVANPGLFLELDWVHPARLRTFLEARSQPAPRQSAVSVKSEPSMASVRPGSPLRVKSEPNSGQRIFDLTSPHRSSSSAPVKTRESAGVIEILSDDDEMEVEAELMAAVASSDPPEPFEVLNHTDSEAQLGVETLSDTVWCDTDIISKVIHGSAKINRQTTVQCVEYLDDIPPNIAFTGLPHRGNRTAHSPCPIAITCFVPATQLTRVTSPAPPAPPEAHSGTGG